MGDDEIKRNRKMDSWLLYWRPIEILVVFVVGLCSGVVTTALLYRDHEKRIQNLELWRRDHDIEYQIHKEKDDSRLKAIEARQTRVITILQEKHNANIP